MEQSAAPHSNGFVEGNNQFQQLAQYAPIAAAMFDTNMKVLFVNDKWLADFNLSVREVAGKSFDEVFSAGESGWREAAERALAGETTRDDAVLLPGSNGRPQRIRREVRPWYKSDGVVGGLVIYTQTLNGRPQDTQTFNKQAVYDEKLAEASRILLEDESPQETIASALAELRAASRADRVSIFQTFEVAGQLMARHLNDVCASGTPSLKGDTVFQRMDFADGLARWQDTLSKGIAINGLVKNLPESERDRLASMGVTAFLAVPIHVRGKWYGFLTFESMQEYFVWSDDDARRLANSAQMIASYVERKGAQDALAEQQQFIRQIIDLNPHLIFAKDDAGRFTLVNKTVAEINGSTPEAMVGKTDADFNPSVSESQQFHVDDLQVIQTRQPKHIPEESITNATTGETRWYETIKVPLERPDGSVQLLGIATDITERKRAEDALKRQQDFLRQIIDLNPAFIFAKDEEGRFTLVNKALADAYGTTPEEIIGKTDGDFNPNEEEVKAFHEADLEVMRSGEAKFIPEETVYDAETGESRWFQTIKVPIEMADSRTQLLGIATDITERKRAEDALKSQQNYLRQIIDLNPSFIFAKDEEGRFTLVNKALADAYASTPEEMVGKSDADYNPNEEEVKAFHEADLEVMRSGQAKFIPEETVYDAETDVSRWFQTIKVPIELDDGSKQLLGVATDISDRKEAEAKREELLNRERIARREAEEAVRMKDLFLATMSHELRTPLNAMIGFLNLMIYSGQLSEDNTHMAQRSLANSQRLLGLINNILDLSRIATGRLEIVPVAFKPRALAYQIIEDLDIQAKQKGLRLELELDEDLPEEVFHDEERIIQITTNLLGNAIKFTDVGRVKLALRRNDSNLVIEVTDTGSGIPPASQHVIFDDFVQLDSSSTRKHGGAGLGLSIVNKLAILMNGSVNLTSEVGKGSRFRVELPLELAVPVKSEEL